MGVFLTGLEDIPSLESSSIPILPMVALFLQHSLQHHIARIRLSSGSALVSEPLLLFALNQLIDIATTLVHLSLIAAHNIGTNIIPMLGQQ